MTLTKKLQVAQKRADYYQNSKARHAARKKLTQFGTEQAGNGIHHPTPASKHSGTKVTIRGTCRACHKPLHLTPWDGKFMPNCRNQCQLYRQPINKFTEEIDNWFRWKYKKVGGNYEL